MKEGAALRVSEEEAQEKLERCQLKLAATKESADIYNNAATDCLAELEIAAEELNKKDAKAQQSKGSREAERHLAERVNFASPAAGARVDRLNTSATFVPPGWQVGTVARDLLRSYGVGALSPYLPLAALERHVLSLSDYLGLDRSTGMPEDALSADMSLGSCWPMAGQRGHFAVRLGLEVMVDRIAIEHIARCAPHTLKVSPCIHLVSLTVLSLSNLSPSPSLSILPSFHPSFHPLTYPTLRRDRAVDVRSAPHEFKIYGSRDGGGAGEVLLEGAYSLDEQAAPLQVFALRKPQPLRTIKLDVLSNHGHTSFTCLYALRVYGQAYN